MNYDLGYKMGELAKKLQEVNDEFKRGQVDAIMGVKQIKTFTREEILKTIDEELSSYRFLSADRRALIQLRNRFKEEE